MLCKLCGGRQHLLCMQAVKLEWWDCPACGGAGVRALGAPATLRLGRGQTVFCRPAPLTPPVAGRE